VSVLLAGCDGGGQASGPPASVVPGAGASGSFVLFAEDQAADNVLAFELTISDATLTDSTGNTVSLLPSAVELEWRSRGLAPTVLSITSVPAATYTGLTITLAAPEMAVFDPITGNVAQETPPLATSSVTLPISVNIISDEVEGLRLDFDLRNSVQLDSSGDFVINPLFAAVPTSFVSGELPGDIDDVLGSITGRDVVNDQLTFSVLAGGQALTVPVDTATLFEGAADLLDLQVNQNAVIDARLQADGTFLAQEIERETPSANQQLRGMVLARTPVAGDLTSFDLLLLDAIPASASLDTGTVVSITVDTNTGFRISTEDLPTATFPNFDFDRQTLRAGQLIHMVERTAGSLLADSIALQEITLVGRVGAAVGTNSFDFLPEGDFYTQNGLAQISVTTSGATELEDMPAGLGSLQASLSIVSVRGVLLFQAGNGVLGSKRVRLLP
jgi:hypothetical protein